MLPQTLPAATRIPAPAQAPDFTGPGAWSAAKVAAHIAAGVHPTRMRQLIATWPQPADYDAAARRGGAAFAAAGWPHPAPAPLLIPRGGWMALAGTPGYPPHLAATHAPPLLLFGLGDRTALTHPGLGVAGTQNMSDYGRAVIETAVAAVPAPHPVVSGLSPGCDTAALTAALAAGIQVVAVLPTGPDQIYPEANAALAAAILTAGGALVSEQPFGTTADTAPARTPSPLAARLAARARIIAGLSCSLVLAEGAGSSGSLHTVWAMLAMGRTVIVAPPKPHARQRTGAQAPLALAADRPRTTDQLTAMGAPAHVAEAWQGRAPLAGAIAADRDELALLVRITVPLSSASTHST